jgi:hypothetical protein
MTSYDRGKTFIEEKGHLLFNVQFYMSDLKVDHNFEAFTLLDLAFNFGGLLGLVIVII